MKLLDCRIGLRVRFARRGLTKTRNALELLGRVGTIDDFHPTRSEVHVDFGGGRSLWLVPRNLDLPDELPDEPDAVRDRLKVIRLPGE